MFRELALEVAIELGLGIEGLGRAVAARTALVAVVIAPGCWLLLGGVDALPRSSLGRSAGERKRIAVC